MIDEMLCYYGRKPEKIKKDFTEMVLDDYIRDIIFKNLDKFKDEFSSKFELKELRKSIRNDLQQLETKIKLLNNFIEKEKFLSKARQVNSK